MTEPKTHRGGSCAWCDGTGRNFDQLPECDENEGIYDRAMEGDPEALAQCPECHECDGTGKYLWAWEPEPGRGTCHNCGDFVVPLMRRDDDSALGYCLPCIREFHEDVCGCDAEGWKP